jgi:protein involved in polysaccharide export with SLBB domain
VARADRPIAVRLIRPRLSLAAAGCLFLAGCQVIWPKPLPQKPATPPITDVAAVSQAYPVCFPDVLELNVAGRPDCSGTRLVYPDGRLDLGLAGEVFAEGCTAAELTQRIADAACVPAQQVRCRVSAARSRVIYLVGSGAAEPRAVAYRGPERATDLLRRAGGLSADVDPDVRVVRRNVARGTAIETFRIDLAAVRRGDARTDLILEPNDEVHVAEDGGVRLASFLPGRSK